MGKAVGLASPASAIANLAHIVGSKAPGAKHEAKQQMRRCCAMFAKTCVIFAEP